jgi:hypothetical protein
LAKIWKRTGASFQGLPRSAARQRLEAPAWSQIYYVLRSALLTESEVGRFKQISRGRFHFISFFGK